MAVLVAAPECGDRIVGGRPNRGGVITLRVGEHATFGPSDYVVTLKLERRR